VVESKVEYLLSKLPVSRFCVFVLLEVQEIADSVVAIAEMNLSECN
jgi:hypothetical protein